MTNFTRSMLLSLCLGAAWLVGCGGNEPPATEGTTMGSDLVIPADDGKLTLTIPAGALPAGTKSDDITVTPIAEADFANTLSDGEFLAAYRLEPEGLKLSEPATVEVSFEPSEVQELIGHHAGVAGDEPLELEVLSPPMTTCT